ncbi:MAG: hypothetical protein C0P70_001570 [Bacillota bacterium]
MADGGHGMMGPATQVAVTHPYTPPPDGMLVVETILPVVSGRASQRLEILCNLSLDRRARYPERVLGTHATAARLAGASLVTDSTGQRRIMVEGELQVFAWCLGRDGTFVLEETVPIQREVPLPPGDGETRNERVTVELVGEPSCGPGTIVRNGEELSVRVPVFIQVEGEVVGERRVFAYAQSNPNTLQPASWHGEDDPDYD